MLGVRAIKQKQYPAARQELAQSVRGPITDLAATLLAAWTHGGPTESKAAIETIDKLAGPDWYAIFKDLHAGLILDLAGQQKEAAKRFERAYKLDPTALRVVQAYGSFLSRQGNTRRGAEGLRDVRRGAAAPSADRWRRSASSRPASSCAPLVDTPQAGAAEVLYGIGAALGRAAARTSASSTCSSRSISRRTHPLALLSLADLYEAMKKPELAIKTYERVPPNSPLQPQRADPARAQSRRARPHRRGEGRASRSSSPPIRTTAKPSWRSAISCAGASSSPNAPTSIPRRSTRIDQGREVELGVFYFRGICYERSKQWPKAEADLKKALELFPDQPHVLNYLGYSWVDQGINLDEGMRMIRRAVEQRADDGYIVDSLGWAYYRLGNYEEAVKHLERAVELKPEDPTINDHLGDAYWRVGRVLEARFQWSHARDLKPEPEDLVKIEDKLKSGLAGRAPRRPPRPSTPRSPAAAESAAWRAGCARRTGARQDQSDAARRSAAAPTAITTSKASSCSPASATR